MELLEQIREVLGCQYISDLPRVSITPLQEPLIFQLSEEEYSLTDYIQALCYILSDDKIHCSSSMDAKRIMVGFWRKDTNRSFADHR